MMTDWRSDDAEAIIFSDYCIQWRPSIDSDGDLMNIYHAIISIEH